MSDFRNAFVLHESIQMANDRLGWGGPGQPGDYEGWKYEWAWNWAIHVDNDAENLYRILALVEEIMTRKHGDTNRMAYEFARRRKTRLIGTREDLEFDWFGGMPQDGWIELFQHYMAKVMDVLWTVVDKSGYTWQYNGERIKIIASTPGIPPDEEEIEDDGYACDSFMEAKALLHTYGYI